MHYSVSSRGMHVADRRILVLRSAFKRVAVGLILGLPLAVGAGRLIAAQLYGVSSALFSQLLETRQRYVREHASPVAVHLGCFPIPAV